MKQNSILKEIRQTRDQLAEEAGMDLKRLFATVAKQENATKAGGETLIPSPSHAAVVREEHK